MRRPPAANTAITPVVLALPIGLILVVPSTELLTWALLAAPLVLLWLGRRRIQPAYQSPLWIASLFLVAVAAGGLMFTGTLAGVGGVGAQIVLPDKLHEPTARLFAISVLCLVAGGMLASVSGRPLPSGTLIIQDLGRAGVAVWLLAVLPAGLLFLTLGADLLQRSDYLAVSPDSITGIAGASLSVGSVGAAGYLAAKSRGLLRVSAGILGITYFLVFLSLGTRRLALAPILFFVGMLLARRGRWTVVALAVAVAAGVALIPVSLFVRGQASHGLIPYSSALLGGGFSYRTTDWSAVINNVLVAFPTSGSTALIRPKIPPEYFWIEVNPLPGQLTRFYEIRHSLRFNRVTPYSAVGEVGNYGWGYVVGFWFVVGLITGYLDRRVGFYAASRHPMLGLLLLGLSIVFTVQSGQYLIRSSFRLLLYALALDLLFRFVVRRGQTSDQSVGSDTFGKRRRVRT